MTCGEPATLSTDGFPAQCAKVARAPLLDPPCREYEEVPPFWGSRRLVGLLSRPQQAGAAELFAHWRRYTGRYGVANLADESGV